jgi:hypothetical protein
MTGWMLLVILAALVGSMFGGGFNSPEPPPFEDTDLGATFATRRQLKKARLLRRRLNV